MEVGGKGGWEVGCHGSPTGRTECGVAGVFKNWTIGDDWVMTTGLVNYHLHSRRGGLTFQEGGEVDRGGGGWPFFSRHLQLLWVTMTINSHTA